ncbi:hypothetical protein Agabi119p4_3306 [Agaricus bisporus var. burnettii]|uniref:F-box domain-containing protein n=1 Tax=Agaricus bisporus var. burnettii TaxID=192524 RepID=A0A8H7F6V7_AGABI|nr:hypothetical protein Agabi119p4_3306 [Agaricus bisporus var. burnettii]
MSRGCCMAQDDEEDKRRNIHGDHYVVHITQPVNLSDGRDQKPRFSVLRHSDHTQPFISCISRRQFIAQLWSECWHFVDIKDIWNVRLVCKQFAKTGQTFLYRVLHCWSPNQEDVDNNNWDMWCKHFLWSATRFVVVATGHFVGHVEEWSFSGIEHTRSLNDTNANIRVLSNFILNSTPSHSLPSELTRAFLKPLIRYQRFQTFH